MDGRGDEFDPAKDVAQEHSNDLFDLEKRAAENAHAQQEGGRGGDSSGGGRAYNSDGSVDEAAEGGGSGGDNSGAGGSSQSAARRDSVGREQNPNSPIRFTGSGGKDGGKTKGGVKGFLRKRLALMAILAALGGGAVVMSSPLLEAPAIVNRLIQEDNSMGTVSKVRHLALIKRILKGGSGSGGGTVFDDEHFKLGDVQKNELKKYNIEAPDGQGSLTYTHANETYSISADEIDMAKAEIPDFGDNFTGGTAESAGQNAGWFDKLTNKVLVRLGLSRNRFRDFEKTNNEALDTENYKNTAKTDKEAEGKAVDDEYWLKVLDENGDPELDDEGNEKVEKIWKEFSKNEDKIGRNDTSETVKSKLNSKAGKIAAGSAHGVTLACQAQSVMNMIGDLVTTAELIQILNWTNGFMEATQKTQVGLGGSSTMLEYLNKLNQVDSGTGKTAIQSSGVSQMFGGKFNPAEESAQKFNFETLERKMAWGQMSTNVSMAEMRKCNMATLAASGVEFFTDALGVIGTYTAAIATGPVGIGAALGLWVSKLVFTTTVMLAVEGIVDVIVNQATEMMTRDLVTDVLGPDLGNALAVGGRSYMGSNHKWRGGSGGDAQAVLAFNNETQAVLAEEAEYDRHTKSPFDISSPNTFLGSLYNSFMQFASSGGSGMGILSGMSSVLSTSMGKILPKAAAQTLENTDLMVEAGDCPDSAEVGVMADMYCNPYIVSDVSTLRLDPGDVYEIVRQLGCPDNENFVNGCSGTPQLDKDGNPVINLDSDLGKYMVLCGKRQVNYGKPDSSASAYISGLGTMSQLVSAAGMAFDVVGDIDQFMQAIKGVTEEGWISGLWCVNTSSNPRWEGEMKWYQRYLEDQGIMEAMGIVEESGVSKAWDEYFEKNPMDTSWEGQLAYFSGHTKEEIELALDWAEYYQLLAEYDPSEDAPAASKNLPWEGGGVVLLDTSNFAVVEVEQPLVAGASELEREVAFRENKRTVNQSI